MEALLDILKELHPEVDYETCDTLLEDEILDSGDMEILLAAIAREYDVQVPEEEVNEENFNSAENMFYLIERLQDED